MQKNIAKINRDTLIFYLDNSDPEIALQDLLDWLGAYTSTTIKVEYENE